MNVDDMKDAVHDTLGELKAQGRGAERALSAKAAAAMVKEHKATAALVAGQAKDIAKLQTQVEVLAKAKRSGGGFPWTLVLLAGGAYAAYRFVPSVKTQIDGLLGRADPGVQGNLTRAGDAAKDAWQDIKQGESPADALKGAAGEVKRGAEKTVDAAQDRAADLKQDAQGAARNLQHDARDAAQDLKQGAARGADDLSRGMK